MRKRLVEATLKCLMADGYAGTTVSSIVRRAGVSRGAHLHHFPTRNALILEATEFLMRRAYRVLGEMLLGIADDADRVRAVVDAAWTEIYGSRLFNAYFELMIAAQRDAELAAAMKELSARTLSTVEVAIGHYFERRGEHAESPRDVFLLLHWLMSGLAAGRHTSASAGEGRHVLDVWARLMASQMQPRKGVSQPPPRPPQWDRQQPQAPSGSKRVSD